MDCITQAINDSCIDIVITGGLPPKDNYCSVKLWAEENNCPFKKDHV